MAEGTSGEHTADRDEPRQHFDKETVKEALAELLEDIPAFRALKAQSGQDAQHTNVSNPLPTDGECLLPVRASHSPLAYQRMIGVAPLNSDGQRPGAARARKSRTNQH